MLVAAEGGGPGRSCTAGALPGRNGGGFRLVCQDSRECAQSSSRGLAGISREAANYWRSGKLLEKQILP